MSHRSAFEFNPTSTGKLSLDAVMPVYHESKFVGLVKVGSYPKDLKLLELKKISGLELMMYHEPTKKVIGTTTKDLNQWIEYESREFQKFKISGKSFFVKQYPLTYDKKVVKDTFIVAGYDSENFDNLNNQFLLTVMGSFAVVVLLTLIVILLFANQLKKSLNGLQEGVLSFFAFINKDSSNAKQITIISNDEIGAMAKIINENIEITERTINEDNEVLSDVKRVVERVKDGFLNEEITKNTQNKNLQELKDSFNDMLKTTSENVCEDVNKLTRILNDYAKLDFTHRIDNDKGGVAKGLNDLANMITQMLMNTTDLGGIYID